MVTDTPAGNQPAAIVTDGLWRKSLSAIRALGKAGFRVTVMGDSIFTTGFWSRYTARRVRAPLASANPETFGRALLRELERYTAAARPVLLPMEEPTLEWLVGHRTELSTVAHFLLPDDRALAVASDKRQTMRWARDLGVAIPATWEPEDEDSFADLAMRLDPGRFVTKPYRGTGSEGVSYGDPRSRDGWIALWRTRGPMLVQERIPREGKGLGVGLLMDDRGECVASFSYERLHEYPVSGGPSTDRRSILNAELVRDSVTLLRSLGWRGVAMVEWKLDPRDQVPRLMEINPRFWGSLELAVRAGVNFPALYAGAALGKPIEPSVGYTLGVRCRWMVPGEILRYASQRPRERLSAFLDGLPELAEEWDTTDLSGTFATLFCTGALAMNPKYWRYARGR